MRRGLLVCVLLLAGRVEAQTVTGARFQLTTGPCTIRSGSGAPSSGLGAVCDTYYRTDSPYTVYRKTGASTWSPVVVEPGSTGLTTVGALGTGSITSGFGAIDVGADGITGGAFSGTTGAFTTSVTTPTLTNGGNLTLSPTGDVIFNPTGNDLLPTTGYDLNIGAITNKFLTLHAAELWVETLVAQDTIATIGGRVLVGPTTTLTADLTSGATSIQVKHNQIASGDRVLLQANGAVEWMAVTSGPSGSAGAYTYSVTRNLDGSGANAWVAGDAVFNTGTTGDGFIDLYSISAITPARFQYIYNFNASGSVYSSNYAEALQFEFLGDGAHDGVNDAIYFGADATFLTLSTEGMTSCATGTATVVWEYWNGSAWTSFSPTGTACAAGHNAVTWTALSGWATTTVNSASAYWIRFRLTNTPGTPFTPSVVKHAVRVAQQWGPSIVGNVRTGTTYSDIAPRWAIGNLNGLYGYATDLYGAAFGDASNAWIKMDATNGIRIGHNTTTKIALDASGNASFAQGTVTIDSSGIDVAEATGGVEVTANAYTFAGGASGAYGMYAYRNSGTTLRGISVNLVDSVATEAGFGTSSGANATTTIRAVAGGSSSANVTLLAGPLGSTNTVQFTGPTLTLGGNSDVVLPDLTIYGNNSSTTSKPYMRSDGNFLVIDSRSGANGGAVYLNNDTNAPVYLALGGGNSTLGSSGATATIYNASVQTSLVLSGLTSCTLQVNGSSQVGCVSDGEAKTDVQRWRGGLDLVGRLRPVSYRWKDGDTGRQIGFIAQDVEDVIPDAVRRQSWGGDLLTLDDRAILAALVNAVQELQRRPR